MASTSAAEPLSAKKRFPNWVEMPEEVMVDIFQRLPTVEVLKIARNVCTTWRRICRYPAIYKAIEMLNPHRDVEDLFDYDFKTVDGLYWHEGQEALTKEAVDLSCGELIDISIEWFATDDLLNHILLSSKKLKALCLFSCFDITDSVLSLAVKRLPHLEKLHLYDTFISAESLENIGRNCPQLKTFIIDKTVIRFNMECDDHALAIAKNMPELRHLQLNDSEMTNNGLEAILKGCPHLQSLDLRMCVKLDLRGDLGKMCMKRFKDFKYEPLCTFIYNFSEG